MGATINGTPTFWIFPPDDETANSVKIIRSSDLNSSDMAGRFPFISHRGYEYMLISVFRGYIHVELLKNRTAAELVRAYRATYDFILRLDSPLQFKCWTTKQERSLNFSSEK